MCLCALVITISEGSLSLSLERRCVNSSTSTGVSVAVIIQDISSLVAPCMSAEETRVRGYASSQKRACCVIGVNGGSGLGGPKPKVFMDGLGTFVVGPQSDVTERCIEVKDVERTEDGWNLSLMPRACNLGTGE